MVYTWLLTSKTLHFHSKPLPNPCVHHNSVSIIVATIVVSLMRCLACCVSPAQVTPDNTASWTSMSVRQTPATTAPARTAWPLSAASAKLASRGVCAKPTSTSASASPARMEAPARTAPMPTAASAPKAPQVKKALTVASPELRCGMGCLGLKVDNYT